MIDLFLGWGRPVVAKLPELKNIFARWIIALL